MAIDMPDLRYTRRNVSLKLVRARALASEIEELLTAYASEEGVDGSSSRLYQVRLAKGLTSSLMDQLEELEGSPTSVRTIAAAERASSELGSDRVWRR